VNGSRCWHFFSSNLICIAGNGANASNVDNGGIEMSRVPEGKELLQVMVAMEVAQAIRVRAAMEAMSLGKVIEQAIIATNAQPLVVKESSRGEHVVQQRKEDPAKGTKSEKKEPKTARVQTAPEDYKGKPWDQVRLDRVMDREGLSTSQMAAQLVSGKTGSAPSRNLVHSWRSGKENIPHTYWSQLEKLFGGGK
jgi:hypothetical protein